MEMHGRLERIESTLRDKPIVPAEDRVMTADKAHLYIGVSTSCLYKMTSEKMIPHYKPTGRRLYFKKEDLDHWMLQNRVKTDEEIEAEAAMYLIKSRTTDKK